MGIRALRPLGAGAIGVFAIAAITLGLRFGASKWLGLF